MARAAFQLNAEVVDKAALRYLDRFDSTVANLKRVMLRQLGKQIARELPLDEQAAAGDALRQLVESLLERYQRSSLLDDVRYATNRADALRRRGTSTRAIRQKLQLKGVPEAAVDRVLERPSDSEGDPDLASARSYAKRRRLGAYRRASEAEYTPERRRKDLAALARAGFSYSIASAALVAD
ncbi:MAG: hypothetical protein RJA70_5037, partial [Pseudomonadota bacterium]